MSRLRFLFCVFYCGGGVSLFVCLVLFLFFLLFILVCWCFFLVACLLDFLRGEGVVDCFCLARIL